jgi:hypothetical protein
VGGKVNSRQLLLRKSTCLSAIGTCLLTARKQNSFFEMTKQMADYFFATLPEHPDDADCNEWVRFISGQPLGMRNK